MRYGYAFAFTVLVASQICFSCKTSAQSRSWAERMAKTVMTIHQDSMVVKKYVTHGPQDKGVRKVEGPSKWDYEIGVTLKGFDELYQHTGQKIYLEYMKKIMDHFILKDGEIRTYELLEYNTDHITPGRIVLTLYKETKEEKYKLAARNLREQLNWQPRTKEGGFWHKHRYPYQMWLDGLYMVGPFYAEYSKTFNEPRNFDDIANQFVWMEKHARDTKTGLLYHGWDESKMQRWADPETGQSPEFWSRAMGWYAMALVDVLDFFPTDHPRRGELLEILQRLSIAIRNYQDPVTGVWFQITDKATIPGNYVEASGSCMFVYSIAKGMRLGYLDPSYSATVSNGFQGILKSFVRTEDKGLIHLEKTCSGAGLGGTPYRDGSFEYYIREPLRTNDLKGIGPFMLASIELQLLKKQP